MDVSVVIFIFIFIGLIGLTIFAFQGNKEDKQKQDAFLKKKGLSLSDFRLSNAKYVGGHPNADMEFSHVAFVPVNDVIEFYYGQFIIKGNDYKFSIKKSDIKNISFEDATTMEKRVTLGRVLLVGVFALAWRKKKKNEIAFVVIDWNDGQFDHSTTFSFEGSNAAQQANMFRNRLITACK